MTHATEMLRLSPFPAGSKEEALGACIEACFERVQVCTACADACLGEEDLTELRSCIALNLSCACLSCADACDATGRILTRWYSAIAAVCGEMLEACRQACRRCAEVCERHAPHHEHCRSAPRCAAAAKRPARRSSPRRWHRWGREHAAGDLRCLVRLQRVPLDVSLEPPPSANAPLS